jgi:hypothetical protein
MRDFPTFDEALNQLGAFLDHHQGRRPSVRWLFREDVALRERSLVVSNRLPRERTRPVEELYSRAVANSAWGILLSAEGIDDDAVYCTLYVSISKDDAEGRLIHGLKLSMLEPLLPVVIVDELAWAKAAEAQTPLQLTSLDDRFQRIG